MMDARCGQVYTALFQGKDGRLTRLSEDEALPLSELKEKLKSCPGPLWLCGDGAHLGLPPGGRSCRCGWLRRISAAKGPPRWAWLPCSI